MVDPDHGELQFCRSHLIVTTIRTMAPGGARGFVGALGTRLGEREINIATFNMGREALGGDAVTIVGVDQIVPDDILAQLRALPQVRYVKVLKF